MAARFALSGRQHLSRRQESDVEDGLRVPRDVLRQDDVAADLGADLVLPGGEGLGAGVGLLARDQLAQDRKSTRLNSSHLVISYAVFCLKKKKNNHINIKFTKKKKQNH